MRTRELAILAAIWVASGIYVVPPGQQAVVRHFGRVVNAGMAPGMHYRMPYPIGRVDRVKVREQQRVSVGFELTDEVIGAERDAGQFLTGDQNLINVPVMVQYTVGDPEAYLFRVRDVPGVIRRAVEVALVDVIARQGVDYVLTIGRTEVQNEAQERAQAVLDAYGAGVAIASVSLQNVQPPAEVKDAFAEVASAREDRNRIIDEARGYSNDILPRARGEARKQLEDAQAYRDRRVNEARGDAARFVKAYEEYRRAKDVTTARLYLETMEEILPRMKSVLVEAGGGGDSLDISLLQRLAREEPRAPVGGDAAKPEAPAGGSAR